MICSLRFYFRHPSEHFDIRAALDGLDALSQMLSFPYSQYSCTVYFDDDKSAGDVFSFPAGETGKARLLNALEHLYASKNDDKPICVLLAGISKGQISKDWSPRCEFVLTPGKMASNLSIDIPFDRHHPSMHRELYVQMIELLSSHGFMINNSFCHTVSHWWQTYAFDSIDVVMNPFRFISSNSILKSAVRHGAKHRLDCLANIYWGNSISISLLPSGVIQKITQILGPDCVRKTAHSLIFVFSAFPQPVSASLFRFFRIRRLLKDRIA